jgi:hypothetical protein
MKSVALALRVTLFTLELAMQCLMFLAVSYVYFFHVWLNGGNHSLTSDEMLSVQIMGDTIRNPVDSTGADVDIDSIATFSDTTIFILEQWSGSVAAATGVLIAAIVRFYFS